MNMPVAVGVDTGEIAMNPDACDLCKVGLQISIGIAPEPMRHAGPGIVHREFADSVSRLPVRVEHIDVEPQQRTGKAGCGERRNCIVRKKTAARLSAAGVIYDW